jgi:hypothetical protein
MVRFRGWKPGDLVYVSYSPQQCGKVVGERKEDILNVHTGALAYVQTWVQVRLIKKGNPIEEFRDHQLHSLQGLVDETRKKLTNHEARLQKAKAL